MNRLSFRVWVGAGLIVLGALMLLERFGIFRGATSILWGLILMAGGAWFLYRFGTHTGSEWWAAIPGCALVGIGMEALLPSVLHNWGGFFFLSALGVGFFCVYLSGRERWWAIIPGGLFITLAFIAVMDSVFGVGESGGFLFLGLGLTFLLLAVLASLQWAWIPGVVLLVLGFVIGTPFAGATNYVWPVALILGGLLLIVQFLRRPR